MTGAGLAAYIRRKTRTTTSTYTDADMLVDVNTAIDDLAGRIQRVRPEMWNMQLLTNLVADTREYAFDANVLNSIVSLEIKFSSSGDYVPATALKKNPSGFALQESIITGAYTNDDPFYFIRRKHIYILSGTIIAVTNGIKTVANIFPASLANLSGSTDLSVAPSATSHGFPREFHELLAREVSIVYKDIHDIKLNREDLLFEQELDAKLEEFSIVNLDLEEIAEVPSSASLWGHGYDL